jgi:hypothetical protein
MSKEAKKDRRENAPNRRNFSRLVQPMLRRQTRYSRAHQRIKGVVLICDGRKLEKATFEDGGDVVGSGECSVGGEFRKGVQVGQLEGGSTDEVIEGEVATKEGSQLEEQERKRKKRTRSNRPRYD